MLAHQRGWVPRARAQRRDRKRALRRIAQPDRLGAVQAVAQAEIGLGRRLRVSIPWADELAIVAAGDRVADQWPQLDRNASLELDRQVRDAAPRIHPVGGDYRLRRADVETFPAAAAVLAHGRVDRERQVRIDVAEKEERACLARD